MLDRRYDPAFHRLLADSYSGLLGHQLVPASIPAGLSARWLYEEAPFAVLAHDASPDPVFLYGNRAAQQCFEYSWEQLIVLPSRLSAEAPKREERRRFLEQVSAKGYITGYRGQRISRTDRRFSIENATVWELRDAAGLHAGQAAMFPVPSPGS